MKMSLLNCYFRNCKRKLCFEESFYSSWDLTPQPQKRSVNSIMMHLDAVGKFAILSHSGRRQSYSYCLKVRKNQKINWFVIDFEDSNFLNFILVAFLHLVNYILEATKLNGRKTLLHSTRNSVWCWQTRKVQRNNYKRTTAKLRANCKTRVFSGKPLIANGTQSAAQRRK